MEGLMSPYPLTLPMLFNRAERLFGDKTITTLTATGKERTTYGEWADAHAQARRRARLARHLRRRPRRHVRLEHRAPPRALLRRAVQRPRPAHAQHPPVPGAAELHRRPRRGRGHLRRPVAAEGAVAAGPRLRDREALRGDGRRRGRRPRRRPDPRLRGADRPAPSRSSSTSRTRTGPRPCATRAAPPATQGRRLLAPLERAALAGAMLADTLAVSRARRRAAGRADVPRQRVGPRPRRR